MRKIDIQRDLWKGSRSGEQAKVVDTAAVPN